MSRLEFYCRPLVAFDPANKEHRRIYHQFLTTSSWGHSPYRFICPDDQGFDLTIMIRNQLIEYYTKKEFGKTTKLPKHDRNKVYERAKKIDRLAK